MVDDHRLRPALGLRTFPRVVDDEGIQVGHGTKHHIGPATLRQSHTFTRQPFHIAVLAHVHDGIRLPSVAQPKIKCKVVMGRYQIRVVVASEGVQVVAPRRLNAHKDLSAPQPRNHEAPFTQHGVLLWRTPAL